ncbi:MAG: nicotinate (nicotinamide) nucleotide adenylyltransferase [Candidatus Saccharimonadales bacterium]
MKPFSVKTKSQQKPTRIGIYAGTFDPVHAGHISFALQAASAARLDELYFIPERRPRGKHQVSHFAHRVAMLRRATKHHPTLKVLEVEDKTFSVAHTLPRLRQRFSGATLVFICGSDVVLGMSHWPQLDQLFATTELCVGRRSRHSSQQIEQALKELCSQPRQTYVIESYSPKISSSKVRQAFREGRLGHGLLASVKAYATKEWLYL